MGNQSVDWCAHQGGIGASGDEDDRNKVRLKFLFKL